MRQIVSLNRKWAFSKEATAAPTEAPVVTEAAPETDTPDEPDPEEKSE